MRHLGFLLLSLLIFPLVQPASAQPEPIPTQVMVRAVAHDAKLLGTVVGGARIVIQDAETGAVLAEGIQMGSTGDTRTIMEPQQRGDTVFDTEGAAGFLATVPLSRPTLVDITAFGPLKPIHAMQRASKRMLLVPDRHVLGEGIVLELNGFTVELLTPEPSRTAGAGTPLSVQARVTMLCSCPTEPGGMWDADAIEISARLVQNGVVAARMPLTYAGSPSHYEGTITLPAAGAYTLEVLASDPEKGNFGIVHQPLVIQ